MLGACNTCVRLQSRFTSSGWMDWLIVGWFFYLFTYLFIDLFIHLFTYLLTYSFFSLFSLLFFFSLFVCLLCLLLFCGCWLCFYFLLVYFLFFVVVCFYVFFFFFFCSLFILSAVLISLSVGLGLIFRWSENKTSYFGVVYKYLRVGMEVTVIKEIFIIM